MQSSHQLAESHVGVPTFLGKNLRLWEGKVVLPEVIQLYKFWSGVTVPTLSLVIPVDLSCLGTVAFV